MSEQPTNVVIHGDCLQVLARLESESVDAIVTDPPYGIDYQSSSRKEKISKIANDKRPFVWFLPEAFRVLKYGGAILCFVRYDVEADFRRAMELAGFKTKAQVIWDKIAHGQGDLTGDFAPQHENVIFAVKGRFRFKGKRPKSVIRCMKVNSGALVHPNEKPVALMAELIESISQPGDVVLDPFLGSGATALGARVTGRHYIGIEYDEAYARLAAERLADKGESDPPPTPASALSLSPE